MNFAEIYACFVFALLPALGWFLVCNERTCCQRIRLISRINSLDWLSLFDGVGYDEHLFRLFTFRDPWAIYPPELANLMRVAA